MESGLYVALSGQLALQRRLDTVANNVANSGTPGFRAEIVNFESVLSRSAVAHTTLGKSRFSPQSGAMTQTGNPLDVAIQGLAHLSVSRQPVSPTRATAGCEHRRRVNSKAAMGTRCSMRAARLCKSIQRGDPWRSRGMGPSVKMASGSA